MVQMDQGEPALVPQWYKLANGNTSNNALRTSTSKPSDENGMSLGSRHKLLSDHERNLRRSLSSNGSVNRDKVSCGRSQAYSSFRRSRDKNQDKNFDSHWRENCSVLIDNRYDYNDSFLSVRVEKDALRRSQSMVAGRQLAPWSKRHEINVADTDAGGSVMTSKSKISFEKDFPSLQAEARQGISDGLLPPVIRTAVQSLPVVSPVIIGTSALAEVPKKVENNGAVEPAVLQIASVHQPSSTVSTMAEALAQIAIPDGNDPLLPVNTQRIEELTLKKCKQLIPVTPSMPKALSCITSEKAKSKTASGGGPSCVTKVAQQNVNLSGRSSARYDNAKTSQVGNFQVLNREKNGASPTAKDGSSSGKDMEPFGHVPSAAAVPLNNQASQKLKVERKNCTSTHISVGERKLLSQAQNRNDFFNLLRKKSLTSSVAIPDSSSTGPTLNSEKGAENLQNTSLVKTDRSAENENCTNGEFSGSDEPERFYVDNGEIGCSLDIEVDPEEEAFLQSLGWDKNAGEEALTEEEIDAFLKKYETQRPLKVFNRNFRITNALASIYGKLGKPSLR